MGCHTVYEVVLLGGFRLGGIVRPAPAGAQRLIALLALRGRLDRSTAAGLLWPDVTEAHAIGSLRSALWRVNGLSPDLVRTDRHSVELGGQVETDVHRLDEQAHELRRGCSIEDAVRMPVPRGGELLPGWDEDWLRVERERVHEVQLIVLSELARALAAAGGNRAIVLALRALAMDPLRESTHRLLIELHIAAGDYGAALHRYARSRDLLASELGVGPSPRMAELLGSIPMQTVFSPPVTCE
jgi:DNA-binding SARP family transcriptional activator